MITQVRSITKRELEAVVLDGDPVQVLDVLDPRYYALGSIRGSVKIPLEELPARCRELDASKAVVTYSADRSCPRAHHAAELLTAWGYDVRVYEGGIAEWRAAGLPLDGPWLRERMSSQEAEMEDRPADIPTVKSAFQSYFNARSAG